MKPNHFTKHLIGTLITFSVIFISAGKILYWPGLAYSALGLIMLGSNYTILRPDSALMEERAHPGQNLKKWDKKILGLLALNTLVTYLVASLDSGRFHWSPSLPWGGYVLGGVLVACGQLLFLIAQKQNKFFSSVVRIQTDRNHTVHTAGLYRLVRHPAYLGIIIQSLGLPLFFGSQWSWLPILFSLILIITRTYWEDKTLTAELPGYQNYTAQTRFRLLPYLW